MDVFIPLAQKVDAKLSEWLSDKKDVDETIVVDLTSIEEVRASTNELAQALGNLSPLLANRILESMTIDEIRDIIELEELPEGAGEGLSGESSTNVNANIDG